MPTPPPDITPPAFVSQLEDRVFRAIKALEFKMETNHLAIVHQIGELAGLLRRLLEKDNE